MEVHAHTHTPRKKWTHYFWEFLMLFLAVFCGFLAENQREHMIEHQREKQFMSSLVEDLITDTLELKKAVRETDSVARYSDSALFFLTTNKITDKIPGKLSDFLGKANPRLSLINTDRTSSQLKNSGAMRLIRQKDVVSEILQYWKQIDETNITLERYLSYRNAAREINFKLFLLPLVYERVLLQERDLARQLRVIDQDPKKWDELTNLVAISGQICRLSHLNNLNKQYQMATTLIELIKKEYHLE